MICNENISVTTMSVCVWGAQLTFWWHKRGWAGGRREHSGGVQPLITEAEAVSVEWLCTCWNEQGDRSADKWDGDGFYFCVYYTPPAAIWSVSGEHLQGVILWHTYRPSVQVSGVRSESSSQPAEHWGMQVWSLQWHLFSIVSNQSLCAAMLDNSTR